MTGNTKLRICSLNCRGLRNKWKRLSLFKSLKEKQLDVICLQEAHINKTDIKTWEKQWGGNIYYNEGTNRSKGEVILISKHITGDVHFIHKEERIIAITIEYQGMRTYIINAYAPNDTNQKIEFFKRVKQIINEYCNYNVILCGDFNCVVSNNLDIVSGNPHNEREIKHFIEMANTLKDAWRFIHGNEKDYTWNRQNPFIARRLDFCFISESLLTSCISTEHVCIPCSDHKAVVLELNDNNFKRGPGYWRFNNSFLKQQEYLTLINEKLDELIEEYRNSTTYINDWEMVKVEIRNASIDYGKRKSCQHKNEEIVTRERLRSTEKRLTEEPENKQYQASLVELKQKLEIIELEKARGAQCRSRIKWVQEGEKNTAYFCNLEKARKTKNVMTRLKKETGEIITNQGEIRKEQKQFYSKLYNQTTESEDIPNDCNNFIDQENIPMLTRDKALECEGIITELEAGKALFGLNNGSSPGGDGLSVEFMKVFWSKIKGFVTKSFNESFEKNELSYTQNQGIITLLHKGKDLDREKLNNWRPITLTNSDYKILAKILALRMGRVVGELINDDQVGYLKGRNIATVLRTIDDVINYMNNLKQPGYLVALDYSKAFDSISKPLLLTAFDKFGFGPDFKKWVNILIKGAKSCINHGGWLSDNIETHCGIRQGCPFSPLAFILAVELMAIKIRKSNINGIQVPTSQTNGTIKIKQMADDTTLFLKNRADLNIAMEILNDFSKFSGLKLNMSKTKALIMGDAEPDNNIQIEYVNELKILGIMFNQKKMAIDIEENWKGRLEKLDEIIKRWHRRDLSIQGKIVVVKTFLVSQFVYVMQSVGLREHVLQTINTKLYKFIWQRKYSNKRAFEKVKRTIMESGHEKGGLNMANMLENQKIFYLNWIGRLYNSQDKNENWSAIPKFHVNEVSRIDNLPRLNCTRREVKGACDIQNAFWKEVILVFLEKKHNYKMQEVMSNTVGNQVIFNNCLIKYRGQTLDFKQWRKRGVDRIKDICDNNRIMTIEEIQHKTQQNYAITIFEYNAIINAIPNQWKEWIENGIGPQQPLEFDNEIEIFNTKSSVIRKYLENKKTNSTVKATAVEFWKRKLDYVICKRTWALPRKATKEVRLRELQWKILHNIYPTNILLYKMGECISQNCTHCPTYLDTMEHFFCTCKKVRPFWNFIEKHIEYLTGNQYSLHTNDILFGLSNSNNEVANHIILIGKMCISKVKKTNAKTPLEIIFDNELALRQISNRHDPRTGVAY